MKIRIAALFLAAAVLLSSCGEPAFSAEAEKTDAPAQPSAGIPAAEPSQPATDPIPQGPSGESFPGVPDASAFEEKNIYSDELYFSNVYITDKEIIKSLDADSTVRSVIFPLNVGSTYRLSFPDDINRIRVCVTEFDPRVRFTARTTWKIAEGKLLRYEPQLPKDKSDIVYTPQKAGEYLIVYTSAVSECEPIYIGESRVLLGHDEDGFWQPAELPDLSEIDSAGALQMKLYDALCAAYPGYVSAENVGRVSRVYTFEPENYEQTMILAAGFEKNDFDACRALGAFLKLMAEEDGSDGALHYLRQRVRLVVFPCVSDGDSVYADYVKISRDETFDVCEVLSRYASKASALISFTGSDFQCDKSAPNAAYFSKAVNHIYERMRESGLAGGQQTFGTDPSDGEATLAGCAYYRYEIPASLCGSTGALPEGSAAKLAFDVESFGNVILTQALARLRGEPEYENCDALFERKTVETRKLSGFIRSGSSVKRTDGGENALLIPLRFGSLFTVLAGDLTGCSFAVLKNDPSALEAGETLGAAFMTTDENSPGGFLYTAKPDDKYLLVLAGKTDTDGMTVLESPLLIGEDTADEWWIPPATGDARGRTNGYVNYEWNAETIFKKLYLPVIEKYPDYISWEIIGKDQSGRYDMYCVTYEPEDYEQIIFLDAGMHGDERDAYLALARFLQLMCEEDGSNAGLHYLHTKVKIVVVPMVNVWSISENHKRYNSTGADLNRDYVDFTQQESKNVRAVVDKYGSSLSFLIDFHNCPDASYDLYYQFSVQAPNAPSVQKTVNHIYERLLRRGFARVPTDLCQEPGKYEKGNVYLQGYAWNELGVPTLVAEHSQGNYFPSHSAAGLTLAVENFGNLIIQQALAKLKTVK